MELELVDPNFFFRITVSVYALPNLLELLDFVAALLPSFLGRDVAETLLIDSDYQDLMAVRPLRDMAELRLGKGLLATITATAEE